MTELMRYELFGWFVYYSHEVSCKLIELSGIKLTLAVGAGDRHDVAYLLPSGC